MKTVQKIIISGVVGTTFMTLYSYLKSKKEKEKYLEPELLNRLIDNSKNLPDIKDQKTNPVGWVMHFATGISFVAAYRLLCKKALRKPTSKNIAVIGSLSGLAGIMIWKTFLSQHDNPPKNDRNGYFKQLFIAHIVFTAAAMASYRRLTKAKKN